MKTAIVSRIGDSYEELKDDDGKKFTIASPRFRVQPALNINNVIIGIAAPVYFAFQPSAKDVLDRSEIYILALKQKNARMDLRQDTEMLVHMSMRYQFLLADETISSKIWDKMTRNMVDLLDLATEKHDAYLVENARKAASVAIEELNEHEYKLVHDPRYNREYVMRANAAMKNR